jgi:SH3 domain protein
MKKNIAVVSMVFFFVLASIYAFAADSRYVTDELQITLRQGKGNEFKITKQLKTGDFLQVLQDEGDYLLVRTEDGAEGYVLTRYTMQGKPKSLIINALNKEIEALKSKLARFEGDSTQQVVQLSDSLGKREEELQLLQEKNDQLARVINQTQAALEAETEKYNQLLEQSSDVAGMSAERDSLRTENETLKGEILSFKATTVQHDRTGMIKWFLAGAGVLLVGWLIGKASRKRRTPW